MDAEFFKGGSRHQLFLVTPNLRSKIFWNFFPLPSALDTEFIGVGMSGHTKFEVQIFWNFFSLPSTLDSEFVRGVWAPTFFGHTKFEVKNFRNFLIYRALWILIFLQGGLGTNFFGHAKFEVKKFSEFFPLTSTLDSEFIGGSWSGQQLFLVMVNLRSKIFWNFLLYRVLWTLIF